MRLSRYALLLVAAAFIALQSAFAQSATPPKSRLANAPTTLTLRGGTVRLAAELWYDQMPTVGEAPKKRLLGVLRLLSDGKRLPAIAIRQAWILHQERLWACKVERQDAASAANAMEFRLIETPTMEELPSGSEVTVIARLRLKNNRARLLRAPAQTVQSVY